MKLALLSLCFIALVLCGDTCVYTEICDCLNHGCAWCDSDHGSGCKIFSTSNEEACKANTTSSWVTVKESCNIKPTGCEGITDFCGCFKEGCGYCKHSPDPAQNGCKQKIGGDNCTVNNGTWLTTHESCSTSTTTSSTGTSTSPSHSCNEILDFCGCFKEGCGYCKHSPDPAQTGCKSKEGGENTCQTHNGTWYSFHESCALAPCSYSTICDCTKDANCGWCSGHTLIEGVEKPWAYCKNKQKVVVGESNYCVSSKGVWAYGAQEKCAEKPVEGHYEAEVKGELNTKPNETTTEVIEEIIQKVVAEKLGISQEKVDVIVKVVSNTDGTTSFTVTVKVANVDVTESTFKSGIDSILSSSVQSSMQQQGVDVKSVNSIEVNNFAGKFVVSLVLGMMIIFM